MTENEAITYLGYFKNWNNDDRWLSNETMEEFVKCCVEALKEIQQYQEIGTVEEVKTQKHNLGVAYKIISDYEAIGTVEECRETVEKQEAERIEYETNAVFSNGFSHYRMGKCPICDNRYNSNDEINYCSKCGQKLDWSEEDE